MSKTYVVWEAEGRLEEDSQGNRARPPKTLFVPVDPQEQTLNIDKNWGGSVLVADGPAQDISWGKGRVTVEAMSATPSDRSKKPADAFRLGPHATTLKAAFEKAEERDYKISNYDSGPRPQRPMLVQAVGDTPESVQELRSFKFKVVQRGTLRSFVEYLPEDEDVREEATAQKAASARKEATAQKAASAGKEATAQKAAKPKKRAAVPGEPPSSKRQRTDTTPAATAETEQQHVAAHLLLLRSTVDAQRQQTTSAAAAVEAGQQQQEHEHGQQPEQQQQQQAKRPARAATGTEQQQQQQQQQRAAEEHPVRGGTAPGSRAFSRDPRRQGRASHMVPAGVRSPGSQRPSLQREEAAAAPQQEGTAAAQPSAEDQPAAHSGPALTKAARAAGGGSGEEARQQTNAKRSLADGEGVAAGRGQHGAGTRAAKRHAASIRGSGPATRTRAEQPAPRAPQPAPRNEPGSAAAAAAPAAAAVAATLEASEPLAARGGSSGAVSTQQAAAQEETRMAKALEVLEKLQQMLEAVPAVPEDLLLGFFARFEDGCAANALELSKRCVRAGSVRVACRQALQQGEPTQTLLELLARPF